MIQQSRLKNLNGTRQAIWCPNCEMENTCIIVANYLGTDTAPKTYRYETILVPNIILVACCKCNVKFLFYNDVSYKLTDLEECAEELQDEIKSAYKEAVRCLSIDAYTTTTMMCRKILMLISMDLGADKNKGFKYYVDYLEENGYITQLIKNWTSYVRVGGNDANHKIESINDQYAMNIFMFVTALLVRVHTMEYLPAEYFDGFCHH